MLLATVLLWALNLSVTRYILTHGLLPLSYATVRYGLAALVFVGIALGLCTAATGAAYSVVDAPLVPTYPPSRMSAVVIPATWLALALSGLGQTGAQNWDVNWEIWPLLVFATLGPLVLTNVLWFR